ncbi:hypothetical protein ASG49_05780 [Marmoricola sp. Leaf446]|uniref:TIGR01777 family oxidoreductase n=1 Tax=Marmoricola sp. Leaf446 TaxID=1736379 RepID=UPI0006FE4E97|nr:TIGR01777 family oxidoreductase [Marmoricola sp. Leaf446]KQT94389.1 hypothetical protein ASG49_05780 [Marmoricola sp. Leaf446]
MRLLIAGSSGFLGTQLRERLVATGHDVTSLVRRAPGSQELRWDPYAAPLGVEVVENHDVVVNLAGSPLVGNPHSSRWARELMNSRITTTSVLADAIAASSAKPVFLAGNGISFYGDHGSEPLTEQAHSRGDALLTRVSRAWEAAAEPASQAGARVVVLRTSPVFDRRSMPLKGLRLLFSAGLGGRLGDGTQHMPVMSARDWVDAVIHTATHDVEGPVNLCSEVTPTNAEFTEALGSLLHRPAVVPAPAVVLRKAGGELGGLVLDSVNAVPEALTRSGYTWHDADVRAVLAEGLSPSR